MSYEMSFYIDGGCRRNGQSNPIAAAAVVEKDQRGNIIHSWSKRLPSVPIPTNQRAELTAIIIALEQALAKARTLDPNQYLDIFIHSDSKYALNCMTTWLPIWKKNGFQNGQRVEVVNRDLIEEAAKLQGDVLELGELMYKYIPRAQNVDADRVCNRAMDYLE